MPSFTFWKSSKPDEVSSQPLNDSVGSRVLEHSVPAQKKVFDLNPGNQDAGVFLFEEADLPPPTPPTTFLPQAAVNLKPEFKADHSPHPDIVVAAEKGEPKPELRVEEGSAIALHTSSESSNPTSAQMSSGVLERFAAAVHDRDSGIYLSDEESLSPRSRPTSFARSERSSPSRTSSLTLKHTNSNKAEILPQRAESSVRRLHRPAELNLGSSITQEGLKQRSELEKRYDLIRNSKTQSKAALRSPTQLLKKRLNMSPRKDRHDEKTRVFTPPRTTSNACLLPGPGAQMGAFTSTSVRARTEAGGRPAWWCKFDKLVVFDGIDLGDDGELKMRTRTSKGLSIARRRGDSEIVVIPMDCAHCQEMLNRHEWKYDIQVCKRSVCWDCKERCKWEVEQEKQMHEINEVIVASRAETSRDRADSVLQDEQIRDEDLMRKVGIEQGRPKSPMEAVGGIEERLESGDP
ncbi:hypothetical protein BKA66DRAFT_421382 [Pyrenochaeta sp. MPI-SDFR-AT-0127]|nr:hypothetical protein BKA66DRAFT_421382 [Pyrenochaeta sp. MPI-SDFR-AT-0127]